MECAAARCDAVVAAGGMWVDAVQNREGSDGGARGSGAAASAGSAHRTAFGGARSPHADGDGEQSPKGEAPIRIEPGGSGGGDPGGGGDYPLCRLLSQPDRGKSGAGSQFAPRSEEHTSELQS